jgi:Uma2 family endonuclease
LIDPERRVVEVYLPGRNAEVFESPGPVTLDPVLPGFTLEPEAIIG